MLEKDCGDGAVKISMLDKIIIAISLVGCLSGCGKSEIDKCVDAKLVQELNRPGTSTVACFRICNGERSFESLPETDKEAIVNECVNPCVSNANVREDVRQKIRTRYEADIRLECLRAASGKS
jgi:hypothetical protein